MTIHLFITIIEVLKGDESYDPHYGLQNISSMSRCDIIAGEVDEFQLPVSCSI